MFGKWLTLERTLSRLSSLHWLPLHIRNIWSILIHSPCSCGPLMHPASQKTHPITRGLPSLDLISFDTLQHDTAPWCRYVPIECQNNFTQNSMNLADLRRMMRIYFLLRQKSRQNARKNLSSPFLGCKRPFAFKSEQVKQACNKALYQNIWGATSEGQTGHRTVLHPGFCETSRSLQWWPSLACPARNC